MKTTTLAAIACSSLLVPSAWAVLGVGDVVYDPTMHATDTAKWSWEQIQWAEKLTTLHNSLTTLRENLQTLVLVKTAIGDPSSIPAILDELALGGALSESGIMETFNELGGIVREGGILAMQLDYLAQPINLNGYKNAARMGGLYAYAYNPDPLARYVAVENAYLRYNAQLQGSAYRAQYMRGQLIRLNSRLGAAATDAESQKVAGSIVTADAALQDIEKSIELSSEQVHISRSMAVNRHDQEKEAFTVSADEAIRQVESELQMPMEDVSPELNFDAQPAEVADVIPMF